ncbi:hypothetical protein SmJEL517_g00934 [Synchytrium microbalum]|uniref:Cupin type-2 domain-containing protein n=1 Tax=Synchytrium microbalum TaxID=1806994 RepID=A0A507CBS7_9FUNG|nr:uncharacterized protein SmJEL517_g00934 [Synchytrium microbalum]TPX37072.1 hypothetical protein SmJEL517_g00934 [Synchytrium microbalum]
MLPGSKRSHPLNEAASRYTIPLGDLVGLKHSGVHLVTLKSGDTSSVDHFHHHTEEWIYILDGQGVACIDGNDIPVEKGTFLGFVRSTRGPSHNMKNTSASDLLYLCGGERRDFDVCVYPKINKIMVNEGGDDGFDGFRRKTFVNTEHMLILHEEAGYGSKRK